MMALFLKKIWFSQMKQFSRFIFQSWLNFYWQCWVPNKNGTRRTDGRKTCQIINDNTCLRSTCSLFYGLYIFSLLPYFVWINLICHFSNIVRPRACLVPISVINMLTAVTFMLPIGSTAGKSTNIPPNVSLWKGQCRELYKIEVF